MAPSKKAKVSKQGDSDDEDYRQKRDRNNQVSACFFLDFRLI